MRFVVSPLGGAAVWGFSAFDTWKVASLIHMGIMRWRYERLFSSVGPAVLAGHPQLNGLANSNE